MSEKNMFQIMIIMLVKVKSHIFPNLTKGRFYGEYFHQTPIITIPFKTQCIATRQIIQSYNSNIKKGPSDENWFSITKAFRTCCAYIRKIHYQTSETCEI